MSHYRPGHKPIRKRHRRPTKISQAYKLSIPRESDVEEKEADDEVSAPVDSGDSANKLACLRVCGDGKLKLLQSGFGTCDEVDSEEGGGEGDDLCCAEEEVVIHDG